MTDNEEEFAAALQGLKNNYPETLPTVRMTIGQKARALSARGITLPAHQIGLAPIAKLAPAADDHFHRFARKLAKALFYRHLHKPVPSDFRIATTWTTGDQPNARELLDALTRFMPLLEAGSRTNVEMGDQFYYRFNVSMDQEVIAYTASFNHRTFLSGVGAREGPGLDFEGFCNLRNWQVR